MAELKLREIQRQVFAADAVVRADDSTLQQCPKRIQIRGVDFAPYVFAALVIDSLVRISLAQSPIASVFICGNKRNRIAYRFIDKLFQRFGLEVFDDLADNVSLSADRTDDADLAGAESTSHAFAVLPVAILVFPADVRFIDFNDTHELLEIWVLHRRPQAMAEIPSGRIRRTDLPLDLFGADTLLAVQHRVQHLEPRLERILGVFKNRASCDRKAVGVSLATFDVGTLPVPRHCEGVDGLRLPASRAGNTLRPAAFLQEVFAGVFVWKLLHQLSQRHHEVSMQQKSLSVKSFILPLSSG